MPKIVVAGGTGFIGRALWRQLSEAGNHVVLLTRNPSRVMGQQAVEWDGRSPGGWQAALEGAAAVVNLCGESVAEGRWTEARKNVLRESRLEPTRALVSAFRQAEAPPRVLINASAVGYYGDRGGEELNEESAMGGDFLAALCGDWEAEARKSESLGARAVRLRIGVVLGAGGGALSKMLLPFKLGLGGPLGSGDQWMSWIALEDLTGLILHLLQSDISGPVNATAPSPVTNRDFSKALGRALGRPAMLPAPAFALRLALGEMAGMLLGGQKAVPARALKAGYDFKHPDVDSALKAALG